MDKTNENNIFISQKEHEVLDIVKEHGVNGYYFINSNDIIQFMPLSEYHNKTIEEKKIIKGKSNIKNDNKIIYSDIYTFCLIHKLYFVFSYVVLNYKHETYLYIKYQSDGNSDFIKNNILFNINKDRKILFINSLCDVIKKFLKISKGDSNNKTSSNGEENKSNIEFSDEDKNNLLIFIAFNNLLKYDNANLLLFNINNYLSNGDIQNENYYFIHILIYYTQFYNNKIHKKINDIGYNIINKVIESTISILINVYPHFMIYDIYGIHNITKYNELLLVSLILPRGSLIHNENFIITTLNKLFNGIYDPNNDLNIHGKSDIDRIENIIQTIIMWIIKEIGIKRTYEISDKIIYDIHLSKFSQ